MASITKRTYKKKSGQQSVYWQVSYYDALGNRHRQTFDKQAQANAFRIRVEGELLTGQHIPESSSVTLKQAAAHFLADFEKDVHTGKRERSTFKQYRSHVKNHIEPSGISGQLLTTIQPKDCRAYLDAILGKMTDRQAAKVMVTLRMVFRFSTERGWIQSNPATPVRVRKETKAKDHIRIPPKKDITKLIETAKEMGAKEHAFVCLGLFCGLRASELRGLPKSNILLGNVVIDQRADQWGVIGAPKTPKSRRTIPMGAYTTRAVQEWLKTAPGTLVFSSTRDTPYSHQNLLRGLWKPLFKRAKVKEYGFHTMRHICASLWIEQGYNPKNVQEMLGHATLAMTMDTYGHLWENTEGRELVNRAEQSLIGTK